MFPEGVHRPYYGYHPGFNLHGARLIRTGKYGIIIIDLTRSLEHTKHHARVKHDMESSITKGNVYESDHSQSNSTIRKSEK